MEDMQIVYLSPKDLKPYENNTRKHNPDDIDGIKKSILAVGFRDPIGIWGKENLIVEGHGRQLAAIELGIERVPCIRLDDMTDEQRKEYAIRHNRTAELSSWDFGKLGEELADLELQGVDMSDLNFDLDELANGDDSNYDIIEDDVPETPEEPKAKRGDIYQLGRHRLMCGDSTDAIDVMALMDGETAELLLTDPPYGISVVSVDKKVGGDKPFGSKGKVGYGQKGKNKILDCNEYAPIIGDDTTDTASANYVIALTCTENQIIFGGNYFTDFLPPSRCWIVWDKQNTGNFADAELAWTSFDKGVRLYHFLWNGLCREGSREVEGKTRVHPTQKPVGMLADILKDFSKENDSVLDCFGGSGSTLIACEQTGRKCFMMELDPHYVDVIIQRWENLTGEKAVLLNG